jgi:hypothetical protein
MDINRKTWKKYASAEQVWWVEPAENMESEKEKACFITQQGSGRDQENRDVSNTNRDMGAI